MSGADPAQISHAGSAPRTTLDAATGPQQLGHQAFLAGLSPGLRSALTTTVNGPGLRHLAVHLTLIAGLALAVALGPPWLRLIALWPLGIALAFLFTLQHEATHRTPFRSPWLNEVSGHAIGIVILQPFLWFRAFHMAHHRHTNDPENDPELGAPKPRTPRQLAWHLAGLAYWRDKIAVLITNARGRCNEVWLPARQASRVTREARAYLAVYLAALVASILWLGPLLFWIWLLPLAFGFPVLRLYLLAEHAGCATTPDMFANSRTIFASRLVRALAWNMPYHAEHHAWPTVPYHKLPELHRLTAEHLRVTSPSYPRFAADYLRDIATDAAARPPAR